MSGSSPDFDRSQLANKDREQLVEIATALGKKPPSRAKKADIVDLILELAGVGHDSAAAGDSPPADTTSGDSSGTSEASQASGSSVAPSRRGGGRNSSAVVSSSETHDDLEGDAPVVVNASPSRGDRVTRSDSGAPNGSGADQGGASAAARSGSAPSGAASTDDGATHTDTRAPHNSDTSNNRGTQGAQGTTDMSSTSGQNGGPGFAPHDPGSTAAGGSQPESGNRRRRRRGRDRGPAQGQSQGQAQGQASASGQGNSQNAGQGSSQNSGQAFEGDPVEVDGVLDLRDDGYGFLRLHGYLPHRDDSYVSVKQVRQFGLRKGDHIKGQSRPPTRSEKNPALLRIDEVNHKEPVLARDRPNFDELTPLYPEEQLRLEHPDTIVDMTPRIIDLLAPIGKGQRGLIVSPPKAGKTSIMKAIARAIEQNNPEVHLMVLLVDERPEEVTDFQRWVRNGEVAASTFDRPTEEHTIIAELVIERAKRIVEEGGDVVILVDGITRLARAYNLTVPASGRIMSGGIDAAALYPPKKFFGAARNVENGGSLTILATALVDTNSRMDDHIFEEFKGTGNMELRLDRRLAERRIYPAIDVEGTSTRHEELLFTKPQLAQVWKLRRVLSGVGSAAGGTNAAALELLVDRMKSFKSNEAFLAEVAKTAG